MPVTQHTEHHLTVKIVKELEQQRVIKETSARKEKEHTHLLRRRLNGMAGERVCGSTNRVTGKIIPRLLTAQSWSACDDPPKADTTARSENTYTAQTALLFLHTLSPVAFTAIFVCQRTNILFSVHSSSGLCFVPAPHRHTLCDWYSAVALRIATTVLGKERRCVSIPHSYLAHLKHSGVLWLQETYTFHTNQPQPQPQSQPQPQ